MSMQAARADIDYFVNIIARVVPLRGALFLVPIEPAVRHEKRPHRGPASASQVSIFVNVFRPVVRQRRRQAFHCNPHERLVDVGIETEILRSALAATNQRLHSEAPYLGISPNVLFIICNFNFGGRLLLFCHDRRASNRRSRTERHNSFGSRSDRRLARRQRVLLCGHILSAMRCSPRLVLRHLKLGSACQELELGVVRLQLRDAHLDRSRDIVGEHVRAAGYHGGDELCLQVGDAVVAETHVGFRR